MPKARYKVKRHSVTQPQGESYRIIPLTRNQNAIVDVADFEFLSQWNWYAHWNCSTKSFYAIRWIPEGEFAMHRQIMNCPENKEVDHADGDTLNNRRINLRICTHQQNAVNKRKRGHREYIGVYKIPRREKWTGEVMHQGKRINIGSFDCPKDAAIARDAIAKEVQGEFARLNFHS